MRAGGVAPSPQGGEAEAHLSSLSFEEHREQTTESASLLGVVGMKRESPDWRAVVVTSNGDQGARKWEVSLTRGSGEGRLGSKNKG
ncbi:unnamed protein product [Linum trigynum]|uniref:Uncharacterized protein n=1 Tax=Linum trigynum TaxID=586398 RepID=A0AAV2EC13_9ROSI